MLNRKRPAWRACALVVIVALCTTGCALVWTKDDDSNQKFKKLAGRIPLAIVTLGISEVVISREYERDRQFQLARERKLQRDALVEKMKTWESAAVATKDDKDRQLYLYFYESTRKEIADLDAQSAAVSASR